LLPNNVIHDTPDANLGAGLKPKASVTDVSFRTALSIVKSAEGRRRCCYRQRSAIVGVFDNIDRLRDSSDHRVERRIVSHPRGKTGWGSLTDSELTVVNLIAQGVANQSVATHLHLSLHTVKTHVHNTFAKLGINPPPS
jgi:DNA-binding CsgD family transcriptional regulator